MGLDTPTPSESIERHEHRLREQLNEGFRLARELDERVRSIPAGKLSAGSDQSDDAASSSSSSTATQLRCSIAAATADVAAAFSRSVRLLLQSSDSSCEYPSSLSAATSPLQTALQALPQQEATKPCASSVLGEAIHSAAEQVKSSPQSTAGWPVKTSRAADQNKQQSNRACASATPSSPLNVIHSPSMLSATASDMSDGSPKPTPLDLAADEATTADPMKAAMGRKRKVQPKVSLKMPAGSAEAAESNTPPDDGHTWRKYGQKNILGAQYPRSYYRCTHKTDTGCPAIKQVQRCDEDDPFFDVVYKGYHTCRSAELDKECWPLAFPQGLSSMLRFPATRSATLIPSSAAASFMLANMGAATQSSTSASLDNLICHVASGVASSDSLPLTYNQPEAQLAVTQAFTPTSAPKLPERSSFSVVNPALQPYNQLNSGQALLTIINDPTGSKRVNVDHLHALLMSSASAAIQDESAMKNEIRGPAAIAGGGQHEHAIDKPYAQLLPAGRAVNAGGEEWAGFGSNTEEIYKRLVASSGCYGVPDVHATSTAQLPLAHHSLLPQLPTTLSIPKHDDAPLAFDAMDNDDDLLGYLDP